MPEAKTPHEIIAEPGLPGDDHAFALVSGDTFAVLDRRGDLQARPGSRHGVYFDGTRFLCGLELLLDGRRPLLLSSGIGSVNHAAFVHLTNPDLGRGGGRLPRDTVHIVRTISVDDARCRVVLSLRSYARTPVPLVLELTFAADFADVFEVRGSTRPARGERLPAVIEPGAVRIDYLGLDGVRRSTRLSFPATPSDVHDGAARFVLELAPGKRTAVVLDVECRVGDAGRGSFARGRRRDTGSGAVLEAAGGSVVDAWIRRSASDLAMVTAEMPEGPFPYAGVPWFSTPFGRDALITAYQVLWLDPGLARGVLRFLAAHQATREDPTTDAEPGKVIHEMRAGEMAALGEIPFRRYYGSVDATPLFVMLAAAYHERTGDDALLQELWSHLELALAWIDGAGDADRDGFVEYRRGSPTGLANQGWRDSFDGVMHEDGTLAGGPIALCEVQAYVYAAKVGMARMAAHFGRPALATQLARDAERLCQAFARAFWCEDLGTFALALDGEKRPCRVRSSNAGHALFTGIASPEHARVLGGTLFSEEHFSGWGIRTLAGASARYNPMSYHNGSVWPHDNALIAIGLARYGESRAAGALLSALAEASTSMDDARLPELFCGFPRLPGEPPILYPVACAPQAWSAGAVFLLLQATLGVTVDAARRQVRFSRPWLPPLVERLTLRRLAVRDATVDLLCERQGDHVALRVLARTGDLDVVLAD